MTFPVWPKSKTPGSVTGDELDWEKFEFYVKFVKSAEGNGESVKVFGQRSATMRNEHM